MSLLIGIDEAGYGPLLGPLVVAASAWRVPDARLKDDLWEVLGDCVTRKPRREDWRLHVDDSKTVFSRSKGIGTLERQVLAFARVAGLATDTLENLLQGVGGQPLAADEIPWYRPADLPLPRAPKTSFAAVADRLGRTMDAAGVRCVGLLAEVVTEPRYNQRVAQTRNKAAVLLEQVLRLIGRATARAGDQRVLVRVDRLGGRANYLDALRSAFPGRHIHVLKTSEACSRYRLAGSGGDWFIEFSVDADNTHLPVALASMLAKYLREALMQRFNAYWRDYLPELRPTAGYYTDAQRFLGEIAPVLPRSGLARDAFVRLR